MSVLNNNALVGAAGKGGAAVTPQRSLRFNPADTAYLSNDTLFTGGSATTWTLSMWVKRSALTPSGSTVTLASAFLTADNPGSCAIYFDANDRLGIGAYWNSWRITTQVFRDLSSWYHLVFVWDTTNTTTEDRVCIYVNGTRVTQFTENTDPGLNAINPFCNNRPVSLDGQNIIGKARAIGGSAWYQLRPFPGYIADVQCVQGQALTPSAFAYPDPATGRWEPKAYAGSYSGNSFYLDFSDNSAATAAALGKDRSGLNNNWVPNNLSISQGNGTYTQGWTASSGFYGSNTIEKGFNGIYGPSLNEMALTLGNTLTWAPTTPVSTGSSFRIFTYPSGGYNTGYTVSIGGVSQAVSTSGSVGEWMNLTSLTGKTISTSTPLVIDTTGFGSRAGFSAIEINGVVLVDNQFSSGNDSLRDHPVSAGIDGGLGGQVSGNYCTWNPLTSSSGTFSQGNLRFEGANSWMSSNGTIAVSSGKWYYEVTVGNATYSPRNFSTAYNAFGWGLPSTVASSTVSRDVVDAVTYQDNGFYKNFSGANTDTGSGINAGDVLSIAVDLDANSYSFYRNNTLVVSGTIGGTPGRELTPRIISYNGAYGVFDVNFGQRPFAYPVSGFKALCDTNLPDPLIKLPSTVMDVKRYDGNGSTQTISGLGFSPDLVWIKMRSSAAGHRLTDAVRGVTKALVPQGTDIERTDTNGLTAFNSDGFSLGSDFDYNNTSSTYVAWCWDAGSSAAATNDSGSIQSTVKVNASAGFSIVTYTGNGLNGATVAHGLNATPAMILYKRRNGLTQDWGVWHTSGGLKLMQLNTASSWWNSGANYWESLPTSTMIYPDTSNGDHYQNISGANYVAYCFAPVANYSSFGSYTGSSDLPFIYTGFRIRWLLIKRTNDTSNWTIIDTQRDTYNLAVNKLFADTSTQENVSNPAGVDATNNRIDILSNGFKHRDANTWTNGAGSTYIYAAFAESPFKYARAR